MTLINSLLLDVADDIETKECLPADSFITAEVAEIELEIALEKTAVDMQNLTRLTNIQEFVEHCKSNGREVEPQVLELIQIQLGLDNIPTLTLESRSEVETLTMESLGSMIKKAYEAVVNGIKAVFRFIRSVLKNVFKLVEWRCSDERINSEMRIIAKNAQKNSKVKMPKGTLEDLAIGKGLDIEKNLESFMEFLYETNSFEDVAEVVQSFIGTIALAAQKYDSDVPLDDKALSEIHNDNAEDFIKDITKALKDYGYTEVGQPQSQSKVAKEMLKTHVIKACPVIPGNISLTAAINKTPESGRYISFYHVHDEVKIDNEVKAIDEKSYGEIAIILKKVNAAETIVIDAVDSTESRINVVIDALNNELKNKPSPVFAKYIKRALSEVESITKPIKQLATNIGRISKATTTYLDKHLENYK